MYKTYSKFIMETGVAAANPRFWHFIYKTATGDLQNICAESLSETIEQLKTIKDSVKVDVVVINNWAFGYCGAVLAHLFDSSIIIFNVAGPFSTSMLGLGNSINPITQPNLIAPFIEPMTFSQRVINVILENLVSLFMSWTDSLSLDVVRKKIGKDIPNFSSIVEKRVAFSLSNSHVVTHGSWPQYKNFAEVGGIHCAPGKELPLDLKQYMDSHPKGVIYVSFGSGFTPSQMTELQKKRVL